MIRALALLLLAAAPVRAAEPETEGPPKPAVTLSLADPSPIIGVSGETELRIVVLDPPETPMLLPRVLCSAGQVEDLSRESPSSFTARYILPSGRFPQPAIIVAEFTTAHGLWRGWLPVRLRAAATPSLRTDPGAQVTLRVDDREFGPQIAPADGIVHIPVVVPPGVEFAKARSVNQHGKSTEQQLDLRVPYSQRLLLVPPESLAAGAVGEVAVYAVEPSGQPANAAAVVMRAAGARVQPLGTRVPGEARFLVTAPTVLREKHLRLEAQLKGQSTTRIAARLRLGPGAPVGLSLEAEAPRLARDGRTAVRVFVNAEDAWGNPVDAHATDVLVDGRTAEVQVGEHGEALVVVTSPPPSRPPHDVIVEGVLGNTHVVKAIPVGSRRPRPFGPAPQGPPPRYTLTPHLGLVWNLGAQAGAALFVEGTAYRSSRYPDIGVGVSLGILSTAFDASSAGGTTRASLLTFPALFEIRERFFSRRAPVFAAIGAGAGFALCHARMSSYGQTVTGQGFGAAVEAAVEAGVMLGHAHLVLSLRYLGVFLDDLSSGDRINGNAAGAVADLGYRAIW